jgi:hypothetical protein
MWEHKKSVNGSGITKGFYTWGSRENYSAELIGQVSTKSKVQKPGLPTCFQGYTVPGVSNVFTARSTIKACIKYIAVVHMGVNW